MGDNRRRAAVVAGATRRLRAGARRPASASGATRSNRRPATSSGTLEPWRRAPARDTAHRADAGDSRRSHRTAHAARRDTADARTGAIGRCTTCAPLRRVGRLYAERRPAIADRARPGGLRPGCARRRVAQLAPGDARWPTGRRGRHLRRDAAPGHDAGRRRIAGGDRIWWAAAGAGRGALRRDLLRPAGRGGAGGLGRHRRPAGARPAHRWTWVGPSAVAPARWCRATLRVRPPTARAPVQSHRGWPAPACRGGSACAPGIGRVPALGFYCGRGGAAARAATGRSLDRRAP